MKLPNDPALPVNAVPTKRWLDNLAFSLNKILKDISQQVNGLSEGSITARHSALSAMPAGGTYKSGDFVPKSSYSEAGGAGSKYVVIGWNRLTSGSAHVLNTDWVEARILTGN